MKSVVIYLTICTVSLFTCEPTFNYEVEGKASYYNDALEGNLTASGDTFYQHRLTAAHLTLPFGTLVKVTNLKNKAEVWVTINDRGPYVKGRIIDLSRRAADSLDLIHRGLGKVLIQARLPEDSPLITVKK